MSKLMPHSNFRKQKSKPGFILCFLFAMIGHGMVWIKMILYSKDSEGWQFLAFPLYNLIYSILIMMIAINVYNNIFGENKLSSTQRNKQPLLIYTSEIISFVSFALLLGFIFVPEVEHTIIGNQLMMDVNMKLMKLFMLIIPLKAEHVNKSTYIYSLILGGIALGVILAMSYVVIRKAFSMVFKQK